MARIGRGSGEVDFGELEMRMVNSGIHGALTGIAETYSAENLRAVALNESLHKEGGWRGQLIEDRPNRRDVFFGDRAKGAVADLMEIIF